MPEKPQAKLIHEAKNTAEFVAALKADRLKIEVPRPSIQPLHVWRTAWPTSNTIKYEVTFNTDRREVAKAIYFREIVDGILIGNLEHKDVVKGYTDLGLAKLLLAILAEDLAEQKIPLIRSDIKKDNLTSLNSHTNARNVFTGERFEHDIQPSKLSKAHYTVNTTIHPTL